MPLIYGQRWVASNLALESSIFSIEFMWLHHMVKYTLRRKVWIISVLCAHSPKRQEHKNMWILFSFLWIFISSADESLIKPSNFSIQLYETVLDTLFLQIIQCLFMHPISVWEANRNKNIPLTHFVRWKFDSTPMHR